MKASRGIIIDGRVYKAGEELPESDLPTDADDDEFESAELPTLEEENVPRRTRK